MRGHVQGLRENRETARTRGRTPVRTPGGRTQTGVPRENILQLLHDAVPPPKEELAAYWAKVWKRRLRISGVGR